MFIVFLKFLLHFFHVFVLKLILINGWDICFFLACFLSVLISLEMCISKHLSSNFKFNVSTLTEFMDSFLKDEHLDIE